MFLLHFKKKKEKKKKNHKQTPTPQEVLKIWRENKQANTT